MQAVSITRRHGASDATAWKPVKDAPKACERLSVRYALTAREAEVLTYLAGGHGSPYIAEKLFISENTVRTHMRNMYRKMGISSKEGLIGLIEAECENG